MQKKVTVEMLVDVDRPDDNSILEDLEQELNCASHSIDIVDYKEVLLVDGSEAVLPAADRRIVDIGPLLDDLRKELGEECDHPTAVCSDEATADEIDMLEALPVIDLEKLRPVAHWAGQYDGYFDGYPVYDVWECSNCGYVIDDGTDCEDDLPHYCPACGAKMEEFCNG